MRPLIGITTSELRPGTLAHAGPRGRRAARRDDARDDLSEGDRSRRAPSRSSSPPSTLEAVPSLVARLDGICLAGGPDLDPVAYGALERHRELGPTNAEHDAFELAVARAADAAGLPMLGICRGAQALNVARGGTLHQHVDGHRQTELAGTPTQRVAVAPDSLLAAITGAGDSARDQLLPPPGRRRARRRPARRRAGGRRDRRGDRGPGAARSCWASSGTPRRSPSAPSTAPCSPR